MDPDLVVEEKTGPNRLGGRRGGGSPMDEAAATGEGTGTGGMGSQSGLGTDEQGSSVTEANVTVVSNSLA